MAHHCGVRLIAFALLFVAILSLFLSVSSVSNVSSVSIVPNCPNCQVEVCTFNKPSKHKRNASVGEFTVYKTRKSECAILKIGAIRSELKTIGSAADGHARFLYTPNILENKPYPIRKAIIYNVSCPGDQLAYFGLMRLDLQPGSWGDYLSVHMPFCTHEITGNNINCSGTPLVGSISHLTFRSDNSDPNGRTGFIGYLQCFNNSSDIGCTSSSGARKKRRSVPTSNSHLPAGEALAALHHLRDASFAVIVTGTTDFSCEDLQLAQKHEDSCSGVLRALARAVLHYINQHQPESMDDCTTTATSIPTTSIPTTSTTSSTGVLIVKEIAKGTCESINTISMCSGLGYKSFYVPNFAGQKNITEIANVLGSDYSYLITSRCSNAIVHLLCVVYAPICQIDPTTTFPVAAYPCKKLCEYVKESCEDNRYFRWPQILNCNDSIYRGEKETFCPPDLGALRIPGEATTVPLTTVKPSSEATTSEMKILDTPDREEYTCSPMTAIPFCSTMRWTNVSFPNFAEDRTQEEAAQTLVSYDLLVRSGCSVHIRHLLCAVYAPICPSTNQIRLAPCRQWCVGIKNECKDVLTGNGVDWPNHMNCDAFPTSEPCFSIPLTSQ